MGLFQLEKHRLTFVSSSLNPTASSTPGLAVAAAPSTATSTHVALGVAGVGAVAPRPAVAPQPLSTHPLLPQRLLLSSQAQARLPSKWPCNLTSVLSVKESSSRAQQGKSCKKNTGSYRTSETSAWDSGDRIVLCTHLM